ncbi:MAG TPA: hypothetical protein PKG81_06830, partial [Candidatus Omnitrophota bacterium]|nr:hypothetical protein [Candidatus Omnitrophota bacterium]
MVLEYGTDADDYLHPKSIRYMAEKPQRIPWLEGGSMYDTMTLRSHLESIAAGRPFTTLGDPKTGKGGAEIVPRDINIIEGVYAVHEDETAGLFDIVIALADEKDDSDKDKFQRKMKRDARRFGIGRGGFTLPFGFYDYAKKQYWEQTDITGVDTREKADIVWSQDTNSARIKKTSLKVPVVINEYQRHFNALKRGLASYASSNDIKPFQIAIEEIVRDYSGNNLSDEAKASRRVAITDAAKIYPFFSSGLLDKVKARMDDSARAVFNDIINEIWNDAQKMIEGKSCVIIPAGGKGATAFPFTTYGPHGKLKYLSTEVGSREKTLLALAIERSLDSSTGVHNQNLFVTTTSDKKTEVYNSAGSVVDGENIIAEPDVAGKFVAICVSAMMLEKKYNKPTDTVVTLMTTDHHIPDAFRSRLGAEIRESQISAVLEPVFSLIGAKDAKGKSAKNKGTILAAKQETFSNRGVYRADVFDDIVDEDRLEGDYRNQGRQWNSGMVSFTIQTLYDALKRYAPEYYDELMRLRNSIGTMEEENVLKSAYARFKELDRKYSIAEQPRVFERLILERISGQKDKTKQPLGMTMVSGLEQWGDLGSIVDRPVDWTGSNFTSGATQDIYVDQNTSDCNVITDRECHGKTIYVLGMTNAAIAYNSKTDVLVIADRDQERKIGDLVERLSVVRPKKPGDPDLNKYVELNYDKVPMTKRSAVNKKLDSAGNSAIEDVNGDAYIFTENSDNNWVYSAEGLVAITCMKGVSVIKTHDEIFVYANDYKDRALTKFNEVVAERVQQIKEHAQNAYARFKEERDAYKLNPDMTKEFAKTGADDFISYYYLTGEILEDAVDLVASVGALHDENLSKAVIGPLFRDIVEKLCDSHSRVDRDTYYKVFSRVIDICRKDDSPEGQKLNAKLSEFGIENAAQMAERNKRAHEAGKFNMKRANDVKKIFIPYRVSVGSDIAVTSPMIKRMT